MYLPTIISMLFLIHSAYGYSQAKFSIVEKSAYSAASEGHLVHIGKKSNLTVSNLEDLKGQNYYIANLPPFLNLLSNLQSRSDVILYQEADFAVIQIDNENEDKEIATFIHNSNGSCGNLIKLGLWSELSAIDPKPGKLKFPVSPNLSSVKSFQEQIDPENILQTIKQLEKKGTRFHKSETGIYVPYELSRMYKKLIPKDRNDVLVTLREVDDSPQKNVVVRIRGKNNPYEKVLLGSHIDSIAGLRGQNYAPGADDDASGTATNLEIFRVLMKNNYIPDRTIEIHGYAAEEVGLIGSATMANYHLRYGVDVVAMVQHDMNMYSGRRDNLSKMYFVSTNTSKILTNHLMKWAENYLNVEAVSAPLTAGTSDHQSWQHRGFAAAFPFENPNDFNSKIHGPNDSTKVFTHANFSALYAKLGLSYLVHYAGMVK